jgi:hypothetical protein
MTSHRPGPRQRAILAAMQAGAELYNQDGVWYYTDDDRTTYVSGPSCRSLFEHGYIYADQEVRLLDGAHWRYALTEQGKAACD